MTTPDITYLSTMPVHPADRCPEHFDDNRAGLMHWQERQWQAAHIQRRYGSMLLVVCGAQRAFVPVTSATLVTGAELISLCTDGTRFGNAETWVKASHEASDRYVNPIVLELILRAIMEYAAEHDYVDDTPVT